MQCQDLKIIISAYAHSLGMLRNTSGLRHSKQLWQLHLNIIYTADLFKGGISMCLKPYSRHSKAHCGANELQL